jgi:hypothetical protein
VENAPKRWESCTLRVPESETKEKNVCLVY